MTRNSRFAVLLLQSQKPELAANIKILALCPRSPEPTAGEERWDIFFGRLGLLGALSPDYKDYLIWELLKCKGLLVTILPQVGSTLAPYVFSGNVHVAHVRCSRHRGLEGLTMQGDGETQDRCSAALLVLRRL